MLMLKAAWHYKHFIWSSIKSEINGKYARSKLGGVWLFIQPLAQAAILAIVLSQLIGARMSGIDSDYAYAVYLLSGMLAWNLFSEATSSAVSMFRDRANLLKKVNFPRICIPAIVVGTALTNHAMMMIVVVSIVAFLGVLPQSALLLLPLIILLNIVFAVSLGLILAIFDVFLRDVGHAWQVFLQFWFWLTPIVYAPDILPAPVKAFMQYNPMYHIVHSYQQVIAYGQLPNAAPLIGLSIITLALVALGGFLFVRASNDVVDAL